MTGEAKAIEKPAGEAPTPAPGKKGRTVKPPGPDAWLLVAEGGEEMSRLISFEC